MCYYSPKLKSKKGSIQTTQEAEIYFNFVGRFVPPSFGEVELTPEELGDYLIPNIIIRKANPLGHYGR